MTDQEYPHWRDAITSSDKVTNAYCALKYAFWHVTYVLLAALGLVLVGVAFVLSKIYWTNSVQRTINVVKSERAADVALVLMLLLFVVNGVLLLYYIALAILANPMLVVWQFAGIGVLTTMLIVALVLEHFASEQLIAVWGMTKQKSVVIGGAVTSTLGQGKKLSEKTPGARRVLGKCPVSLTLSPKWFESLFDRFVED